MENMASVADAKSAVGKGKIRVFFKQRGGTKISIVDMPMEVWECYIQYEQVDRWDMPMEIWNYYLKDEENNNNIPKFWCWNSEDGGAWGFDISPIDFQERYDVLFDLSE